MCNNKFQAAAAAVTAAVAAAAAATMHSDCRLVSGEVEYKQGHRRVFDWIFTSRMRGSDWLVFLQVCNSY